VEPVVIPLLLALVAGIGAYLLFTAVAFRWTGLGPGPARRVGALGDRVRGSATVGHRPAREWLIQAGLGEVRPVEFAMAVAVLFMAGAAGGALLFGGVVPAFMIGAFAATLPVATYRRRRAVRRQRARDAWPRMIDEIRILTGSAGRSIPQALFEVGLSGPDDLRPAFAAAHREWLLSTDFGRTIVVLKEQLADPTADAACETLLIAHDLGGTDLSRRLEDLAADRRADTQGRKDAQARQAGVRFARRFVLVVPIGMAVVGLSVGTGRAAYETPMGQLLVTIAILVIVGCWVWAGHIMRLPDEERVLR
jgi:tight adherence protein B